MVPTGLMAKTVLMVKTVRMALTVLMGKTALTESLLTRFGSITGTREPKLTS